MTRDGFDFLFLYLYETDAAQHRGGDVLAAVEQADAALALLVEAAGGGTPFLERYAVMVVADHSPERRWSAAVDAAEAFEGLRAVPLQPPLRSGPSVTWRWPPATGWRWPTCCPAAV